MGAAVMMTPEERDQVITETLLAVQPVIEAAVQAGVAAAVSRMGLVRVLDGTVVGADGRELTVQPTGGDGEDELIYATATWASQTIDDDVLVLFVPPAGAIALGRLPAPTE